MNTEEFIQKAKTIHENKYDYSLVDYLNSKTKVKIICNTCNNVFEQTPNNHLRKRGCPYCSGKKNIQEFTKIAAVIHKNKYDYSLVDYKTAKTKIKIICKEHGIFKQTPEVHLRGSGCQKCGIIKNSLNRLNDFFTEEAEKLHPDFDYSLVEYRGIDIKVKIICPNGHLFKQTPYKHINCFQGCPICNASSGEQLIISWLNSNGFKDDYIFQYSFKDCKDVNPLPFDFYIPSKNLLIEYQGEQHYFPCKKFGGYKTFLKQKHHDWLKRKYCINNKLNLLTIPYWDNKIVNNILKENLNGI